MTGLLDWLRARLFYPALLLLVALAQLLRPLLGMDRVVALLQRALRWARGRH